MNGRTFPYMVMMGNLYNRKKGKDMWMKFRRILQIASLMFLVLCTGCHSDQDKIFSESAGTTTQPSSKETSETVMPEVDYDSSNYIGPDKSV